MAIAVVSMAYMTTAQCVIIAAVIVQYVLHHLYVLNVILHIILRLGIVLACKGLMIMGLLVSIVIHIVQNVLVLLLVQNVKCHTTSSMDIVHANQELMIMAQLVLIVPPIVLSVLDHQHAHNATPLTL